VTPGNLLKFMMQLAGGGLAGVEFGRFVKGRWSVSGRRCTRR